MNKNIYIYIIIVLILLSCETYKTYNYSLKESIIFPDSSENYIIQNILHKDKIIFTQSKYTNFFANSFSVYNEKVYLVGYETISTTKAIEHHTLDENIEMGWTKSEYNIRYVEGQESNAILIVDDTRTELTKSLKNAVATDIFISNGDVYISGYETNEYVWSVESNFIGGTNTIFEKDPMYIAKYWKNGEEYIIAKGEKSTWASKIIVQDGNVYILGRENGELKYWVNEKSNAIENASWSYFKNGKTYKIENTNEKLYIGSMYINNGNVYLCGGSGAISLVNNPDPQNGIARYWINGDGFLLKHDNYWAGAEDIIVVNNNIHIIGAIYTEDKGVKENFLNGIGYWNNGKLIWSYVTNKDDKTRMRIWSTNNDIFWFVETSEEYVIWKNNSKKYTYKKDSEKFSDSHRHARVFLDGKDMYIMENKFINYLNIHIISNEHLNQ